MSESGFVEREGVRLACRDFGGSGAPVLLLHGLAGYAGEWRRTAEWLRERHRVVAFDARAHGRSERRPHYVSRSAHVADAVHVIEQLGLGPCAVIGQSMGGLTALLLAASRPDLVRSLIVAEAMPAAPDEATILAVERSLRSWPVPFDTRSAAVEFFGGASSAAAQTWADGLEQRDGGWRPQFEIAVMIRTLREAPPGSYWQEWGQIHCPTLIVRGARGTLTQDAAQQMLERLPNSRLVEIHEAGHDVHLDRPAEWRQAVEDFLASHA